MTNSKVIDKKFIKNCNSVAQDANKMFNSGYKPEEIIKMLMENTGMDKADACLAIYIGMSYGVK